MRTYQRLPLLARATAVAAAAGVALLSAACSSGSGGSSTKTEADFGIEGISVQTGEVWELNRPIDVVFNKPVDFSSVSLNTINVLTTTGAPATGSFQLLADLRTVRFQPTCPTLADSSDSGLKPGGVQYVLHVLGTTQQGVTVQAADGDTLEEGRSVTFSTPASEDAQDLFVDTISGPPTPRIRGRSGVPIDDLNATYLEIGGDPDNRVYFLWQTATQEGLLEGGFLVPLNQYSIQDNRVAVVLHVNQAVSPDALNVSDALLQLQYLDESADPVWKDIATDVELIANCTDTGAALRLEPVGILPQETQLRVIVREGFSDLVGDRTLLDSTSFAKMSSAAVSFPTLSPPDVGADEVLESFVLSGDQPGSLEDVDAAFSTPHAAWEDGKLTAAFDFGGTGGPNGNFDWHVPPGVDFILDTTSSSITGGPGGAPQVTQAVINGVVNVRNLFVPESSSILIQGPNTCTILASGWVRVDGRISVDGASNKGVGTLNTTHLPEPGAAGNGGGGKGGTGSFLTTQSTPRGGTGFGPFNTSNGGGQGGETGYSDAGIPNRRGAGGGGGAFGPDYYYESDDAPCVLVRCQELIGFDAEFGCGGGVDPGLGAESQSDRAQGGQIGPRPFLDERDDNDFLGTLITNEGELIQGELDRLWAGAGGGAGGDAVSSSTFPLTPFTITGDEKGGGGGGAAGGLEILAIGEIEITGAPDGSIQGRITADGGQGGGGENTIFFNRVGGAGAGGSGGHIVLSSASFISIGGKASLAGVWYNDEGNGHKPRAVSALGGQGGAGKGNEGGSPFNGLKTPWRCDAIPLEFFANADCDGDGTDEQNAPFDDSCFNMLNDLADELGPNLAAGGDGSPGLIQLHVDDPAANLRFPDILGVYGQGMDVTPVMSPPPVGWRSPSEPADFMVPFFGKDSTAQSKWIPLGLARIDSGGEVGDPVEFFFEGTDPTSGLIEHVGSTQALLDPIIGPDILSEAPEAPYIDGDDPFTIVLDASQLEDDVYKRNPQLTREFTLLVEDLGSGVVASESYSIASGEYDAGNDELRLTVEGETSLADFEPTGQAQVSLIPHYTRVSTNTVIGAYPVTTDIKVFFQATVADAEGGPDETDGVPTELTSDIEDLNDGTHYDFFRFRVEFDLNNTGGGVDLDTSRPALEFLRVPFRF